MKGTILAMANACALLLSVGCSSVADKPARTLPPDPTCDAIHDRLGNPDRITGSGRMFLHYDLKDGQTVTLIVSGKEIVGTQVSRRKTPDYVPEPQH